MAWTLAADNIASTKTSTSISHSMAHVLVQFSAHLQVPPTLPTPLVLIGKKARHSRIKWPVKRTKKGGINKGACQRQGRGEAQ